MHRVGIAVVLGIVALGGFVYWNSTRDTSNDPRTIGDFYSTNTEEVSGTSSGISEGGEGNYSIDNQTMSKATITTNKGIIEIEFFNTDAPRAVENFLSLAEKGFYDGIIFHRVIPGFMIQGGDPTGTGRGGPGYQFADELDPNTESARRGYTRGTVAMANAGPNTNGSQFFIMHQDYPLPHNYTIFGRVTSGIEVVDAIAGVSTGPGDKPLEDVVMNSVTTER